MSVPLDRKPERAVQAKIRGIQKYIPDGLKTRKGDPGKSQGSSENNNKKNDDEKKKNKTETKTEASQFKLVEWKNALCAGLNKWQLLPYMID